MIPFLSSLDVKQSVDMIARTVINSTRIQHPTLLLALLFTLLSAWYPPCYPPTFRQVSGRLSNSICAPSFRYPFHHDIYLEF